jgi:protein gp37
MGDGTSIEWTDATWNPVRGCSRVSDGCMNCYAMGQAHRQNIPGGAYEGLTAIRNGRVDWSGQIKLVPELLGLPLRWKKPRRVFVDSMSDLFHHGVPFEFVDSVFATMARAHQHTFQILTKRPERMREYVIGVSNDPARRHKIAAPAADSRGDGWPLRNVWLGTSVENQAAMNARIAHLILTPARVRFLSCEPLLGPVELWDGDTTYGEVPLGEAVHWVIAGGESGHGARPMETEWVRSLRDQCQQRGIAFFFKQWGSFLPVSQDPLLHERNGPGVTNIRFEDPNAKGGDAWHKVGKKQAGRLLDGQTWNQMPTEAA